MQTDMGPRRKALVNALGGDVPDPMMGGLPGAAGIAPGEMMPNTGAAPKLDQPMPPPMPDVAAAAPPPFQRNNTRLMEGNAEKLANVEHAKKSPKYDFLQLANQGKYGYNQIPEMLKELQAGPNARHWQGWEGDRGDIVYKGDPSQLGEEWGGVKSVDLVGGYGKDGSNATGWRWGVDDDGAIAAAQGGSGGIPGGGNLGALTGAQSNLDSLLQGDPQKQIQEALAALTGQGNRPNLAGLIASLSGGR